MAGVLEALVQECGLAVGVRAPKEERRERKARTRTVLQRQQCLRDDHIVKDIVVGHLQQLRQRRRRHRMTGISTITKHNPDVGTVSTEETADGETATRDTCDQWDATR
jgi:hypothetical protein